MRTRSIAPAQIIHSIGPERKISCSGALTRKSGQAVCSEAVLQCYLHDSCRTGAYDLPESVAAKVRSGIRKIGTIEHVLCFSSEFQALPLSDRKQSRQARVDDEGPWAANRTRRHICLGAGDWFR